MTPNERTILLVEDEPMLARLYAVALEARQFRVLTAGNKQTAITLLVEHEPELVILDLMIPISPGEELMTYDHPVGFDILEWLKKHPERKVTKVIVLTNLDVDEHKLHAEELGAEEFLLKVDFSPNEIVQRVERVLLTA